MSRSALLEDPGDRLFERRVGHAHIVDDMKVEDRGEDLGHLRAVDLDVGGRPFSPGQLAEPLDIDGETLQDSNTKDLIFKIPDLIAFLSSVFTLEPGDIVSTGTPSGVGAARKPPRFLRPGEEVTVKVEGIGELMNPVVAEG